MRIFPARIAASVLSPALALLVIAGEAASQPGSASARNLPVSAFVDSAGLVLALAALDLPPLSRGTPPLFSVSFDSAGAAEVEPIFESVPADYAAPVVAAIRAHLLPRASSAPAALTILRVEAGPGAQVSRPRMVETAPRLRNGPWRRDLQRLVGRFARDESRRMGGTYAVEVRVRVLADGTVDRSSVLLVSSTGDFSLDRELVSLAGRMRFEPALVDGIPVRAWVSQPFEFVVPPSTLPRTPEAPEPW